MKLVNINNQLHLVEVLDEVDYIQALEEQLERMNRLVAYQEIKQGYIDLFFADLKLHINIHKHDYLKTDSHFDYSVVEDELYNISKVVKQIDNDIQEEVYKDNEQH